MTLDLIVTKTQNPVTSSMHVDRTRQVELLSNAIKEGKNVFLIRAPAGYGKSVLTAQWLQNYKNQCWYRLDESDSDPIIFIKYLYHTLSQSLPLIDKQPIDRDDLANSPDKHLSKIINEINDFRKPVFLVLEDTFRIKGEPVPSLLNKLALYAPANLKLVIIARDNCGSPFTGFQLPGRCKEITHLNLQFNPNDVELLIKKSLGISETKDLTQRLVKHTEGWPICWPHILETTDALPKLKYGEVDFFDANFRHYLSNICADYLDETKIFYMKALSLLGQFDISLASFVLDQSEKYTRNLIGNLCETGLFVFPIEGEKNTFRINNILRQYFINEIKTSENFDEKNYYARTYQWCHEQGRTDDAINFALKSENFDAAIKLISSMGFALIKVGNFSRLQLWVKDIPDDKIKENKELILHYCWSLVHVGLTKKAAHWLDHLKNSLDNETDQSVHELFLLQYNTLRLINAVMRDDIETARSRLEFETPVIEEFAFVLGALNNARSVTFYNIGQKENAMECALTARKQHEIEGYISGVLYSYAHEIMIHLSQCNLYASQKVLDEAESMLRKLGLSDNASIIAVIKAPKAAILFAWNQLEDARELLEEFIPFMDDSAFIGTRRLAYSTYAKILAAQSNEDQAFSVLDRYAHMSREYDTSYIKIECEYLKCQMLIKTSRFDEARRRIKKIGLNLSTLPTPPQQWDRVRLKEILLWCTYNIGRQTRVDLLCLLDHMIDLAQRSGKIQIQLEFLFLKIEHLSQFSNRIYASETLMKVLDIVEAEDYTRIFFDQEINFEVMLRELLNMEGIDDRREKFIRRVLISYENARSRTDSRQPKTIQHDIRSQKQDFHDHNLSKRETEILNLLAQGINNNKIAENLMISTNTVRWHIGNILSKLNVRNRTQAVVKFLQQNA